MATAPAVTARFRRLALPMTRMPLWLLALPLLAACTPTTTATNTRPATAPAAPAAPTRPAEDAAAILADPKLGEILGKPAESILALFGSASLDRAEADTRHLQFGGSPCILDVYFYPETDGAPATARHVEARMIDGKDASAGDCISRRLRDLEQERTAQQVS